MTRRWREAAADPLRPVVRFALRHWMRHEEMVRLRQQIRYLALAELLRRDRSDDGDLTPYELSVFSQNGEDGILSEIFRRIGPGDRTFVEIGASPNESNSAFLADARGWSGTFIEASDDELRELRSKYAASTRVRIVRSFVTPSNAAELSARVRPSGRLDLLSIDIDGNDYWVWKALAGLRPRVVVIEYNAHLDPTEVKVQPYAESAWDGTSFFGASLGAIVQLGQELGYRLVHLDLSGINAFFVEETAASGNFPSEEEVLRRVPNFYLYGFRHPTGAGEAGYLSPAAEGKDPSGR